MFKKFDCKESVSGVSQIKSSVQREIRNKILIDYSNADEHFDDIIPKKNLKLIKCHHHIELIAFSGEVIFFRDSQQHFIPSLKTIHKYPYILPKMQADDGAIDFILRGANIMCPGLTSKGGKMSKVETNEIVGIYVESKKHALAIGLMKMSTDDIEKKNKGIAIEVLNYIGDGLWNMKNIN